MYDVYGIIGDPVSHSLSPLMHNYAFRKLNIKAVYGAFRVKPEDLENAIKGIRALNIKGLSVTIPHKENVMKYLDEIDEIGLEIGAINTIVNKEGILKGYNTDWLGVLYAFEKNGVNLRDKKIVILGAGGASKAVIYAVKKGGAKKIEVYNRTFEKAQKLADKFKIIARPWEELDRSSGDIIIQTTSVGLKEWKSPVEEEILKRFKIAMDIVYSPLKTKFLTLAEKYAKIIDGLQMLVYQGVEQFKLWTGKEPPTEEIKELVYNEVKKSEK